MNSLISRWAPRVGAGYLGTFTVPRGVRPPAPPSPPHAPPPAPTPQHTPPPVPAPPLRRPAGAAVAVVAVQPRALPGG